MGDVLNASSSFKPTSISFRRSKTWYFLIKRSLDFLLAIVLLIIFFLPMLGIAVLIKLDSKGPIFFKQRRVGSYRVRKGDRWTWEVVEFTCLKFRTMMHHADPTIHQSYVAALIQNNIEKMDELQSCKQDIRKLVFDPRITRIGRFLRKYSLDELPQFINVLIGNMSLVGPRPAIGYEVDLYKPWHKGRLNAQPGITGLQQVKARCMVDFDDQVKYDLEYIQNQSLWLDLKILLMTPLVVLRHRGAC
jgi:lipopolysaccharide/colanic/teichoic acid biosynthesis glycosyltransferase